MTPISARNQLSILFIALLLVFAGCSSKTKNSPSADSSAPGSTGEKGAPVTSLKFVKASASDAQITAGSSGEAIVRVAVQSGYHVNANPPTYSYLRATELVIPTGNIVSVSFITYPTATLKKFAFAEKPLAVYEGEVLIKVVFKTTGSVEKGSHSIAAKLNIQACDDEVCYAPGTLDLSIPVTIK
jgi:Disulphide bond corrector protein DsbC